MDRELRELLRRLRAAPGDEELLERAVAARARGGAPSGGLAWPPGPGTQLGPWRITSDECWSDERHGNAPVARHEGRAVEATLKLARVEPEPMRDARAAVVADLVRDGDPDLAASWGQEGEVEWAVEVLWGDPGWLEWGWPGARGGPVAPRAAVGLGLELARGLWRLRRVGLPCTWVTPNEVLRAPSGKIGLCFHPPRFSPRLMPEEYVDLDHPPRRSRVGTLPGNPLYAPPEVASGRERGAPPSLDVHAVGALLHTALSGRPPVLGHQTVSELLSHLERPAPPLLERCPDLDPQLACLVDLCLTRDPARRWPTSIEGVIEELERWLRSEPLRLPRAGALRRLLGL